MMVLSCTTRTSASAAVTASTPVRPESGAFSSRGKMDKCTFCAGGPEETHSSDEQRKYGSNRLAEGKLPLCAEMCSTKALLAGDADIISNIYRERVVNRGASVLDWGVSYEKASLRESRNMKGKVSE
jgi:formate dehydrogenase iron-sulfur subunit